MGSLRRWLGLACFGMLLASLAAAAGESDRKGSVTQFLRAVWTEKEGAPADTWAIAQTSDGWLWFGGHNGLFRFDGVRLRRIAIDRRSNQSSAVSALFALPSGELLLVLMNGVVITLRAGKFDHFENEQTRV